MENNRSCKAEVNKDSDPPYEMDTRSLASNSQPPQQGMENANYTKLAPKKR